MNNEKLKPILAYITVICAIVYLFQKESSRDTKLHCAQAIVISIAYLILSFVIGFLARLTGIPFISLIPYATYIVFIVLGIVKASKGEDPELPVIGDIAKSIFGKQIEK